MRRPVLPGGRDFVFPRPPMARPGGQGFVPRRALRRALVLGAAFAVDRAVGDPVRPTHPARLMGRAIQAYELLVRPLARGEGAEKNAGVLLAAGLPLTAYVAVWSLLRRAPRGLRLPAEVWLVSTALAGKDLSDAARRVERGLDHCLAEGRREVSMIVGRDTADMTEDEVVRATIETVAENTGDGVVSPMLYAALGGAPLALAFKAVSTRDSMVGYQNDRYRHFGRASARLDDLANLAPARLTGVLAAAAAGRGPGAVTRWWEERRHHSSPNAGLVEASFAQALRVQLGGAARYGGVLHPRPSVGREYRAPRRADIERAIRLSERVGALGLGAAVAALVSAVVFGAGRRGS